MSLLTERVAYLKGLAEGMEFSEKSSEQKMLLQILNLLSDVADAIGDLEDNQAEIEDYIEEIDEDLGALESFLFDEDEQDDGDGPDEYEYPCCGEMDCGCAVDFEDANGEEADDDAQEQLAAPAAQEPHVN
ncbi:MAG: CD1247 N-terminal domain-containing protein [Christensenellales bacterium]|jgi:hypothetical protein